MLDSDKLVLHALLVSICRRSDAGAHSDFDARAILPDVVFETQSVLAKFAYASNHRRTCCRLPAEVLGMCLSFLPFRARIRASRISRAWRAAALTTPSLWADIGEQDLGHPITVAALELAFSRAGAVPLSLELDCELTGEMLGLVQRSMRKIAHLQLPHTGDSALLEQPAPLLHSLHLMGVTELTENFWGVQRRSAKLRAEEQIRFPHPCQGLSNLTTLIVGRCGTVTLRDIFTMCPRLEKLEMKDVIAHNVQSLGIPPASLKELRLITIENRAQLFPAVSAYRMAANLTHMEILYGCDSPDNVYGCYDEGPDANALALALHGVVDLRIGPTFQELHIEVSYPDNRCLDLWLHHMIKDDWCDDFSPVFNQHTECFTNLRALYMPIFALEAFAADAPPLPVLSALVICIAEDFTLRGGVAVESDKTEYPWYMLRHLARVTPQRVELIVEPHPRRCWPYEPPTLPTADEARALVAELADLVGPLALTIAGFAQDTVPRDRKLKPGIDLVFLS